MVGMCGEAAADPKLIPLLLAFGLDEFSVKRNKRIKDKKDDFKLYSRRMQGIS